MPEAEGKEHQLPGLRLASLEATVHTLRELRDSGKFLFFLPRRNWFSLIGDLDEFHSALAKRLGAELDKSEAEKALREVRVFLGAILRFRNEEATISVLRDFYRITRMEKEEDGLEDLIKKKIQIVKEHLLTDGLERRAQRVFSSSGLCLEEIDVDVIGQRFDHLYQSEISHPFLRLRVRYSSAEPNVMSLFRWINVDSPEEVQSFEIECDETDIDLLIRRLVTAKQRLLAASVKGEV